MKWLLLPIIAFVVAFLPSLVYAEDGTERDDNLLLRIGADTTIQEGETVGTVIVIDGNLTIDGAVRNNVFVVDGDVTVNGRVDHEVTVVSGTLTLNAGSRVDEVRSINGNFVRNEGATVTGTIHERDGFAIGAAGLVAMSILFWAGLTVTAVVAGLVFSAIGGRQLTKAAFATTQDTPWTILASVFVWIGLPIVAAILIATLVGLPLGLGVFVVLMPALWFLGYIVVATRVGIAITRWRPADEDQHPYMAATAGTLLFQLLALIPGIGVLVIGVAGLWGAGALALIAYRAAHHGGPHATAAPRVGPALPVGE
jgi:hypothetical protein